MSDGEGIYLSSTNSYMWDLFKEIRNKAEDGSEIKALAEQGLGFLREEAL